MTNDDTYLKEQQRVKDDIIKLKKQYFDQKREYNKLLFSDARADNLTENLIEIAKKLNQEKPLDFKRCIVDTSDKEAILFLADWHYGMVTDNIFNTFNTEICKSRVAELVVKTKEYLVLHKIKKLNIIVIGDLAHGGIHVSARVSSEELVSDQLMKVSEILAEAIAEMSSVVEFTDVHSTYGNHMRSIQNKKDNIHADNMEKIIPWWLKQRFANRGDIVVFDSDYYEFIKLNVLGYNICACHGDLEKFRNLGITLNTIFTKVYGETIDYCIMGDKHHIEEFEAYGIESVILRCLCGTDDYAAENRLFSKAGQTLMIFSKSEGRECTYNIKLN